MIRVVYFVSNTERTARFYQKAFGAKRMKPPQAQDYLPAEWIQVKSGAMEIGFHKLGFLTAKKRQPGCPFKLVFKVANVARKRQALRRMGVKMTPIWPLKKGFICDGWDPEGHRFQITDR